MSFTPPILFPVVAEAADEMEVLAEHVDLLDVTNIFTAVLIVVTAMVVSRMVTVTLERLGEGKATRRLFLMKVLSFTRLAIFVLAAYLVLATFIDFEEDTTALLGLAGTLAVAIGFALQDTASSLVAGILIIVDQPFQVGDRIEFDGHYGEVTEIGLRSTTIFTLDHDEVSIPNNLFLEKEVASSNAGELVKQCKFRFYISMTADFELAKKIVYEACITSKYVYLDEPVEMRVRDELTDFAFVTLVQGRAYVIDVRHERHFLTDVMERVKPAFRRHGIKYPYIRKYSVEDKEWRDFDLSPMPHRTSPPMLGGDSEEVGDDGFDPTIEFDESSRVGIAAKLEESKNRLSHGQIGGGDAISKMETSSQLEAADGDVNGSDEE